MNNAQRKPVVVGSALADDRRGAPRHSAQDLPGCRVKLSTGVEVNLIDVSQTGARFDCDRRLMQGSIVALRLSLSDGEVTVRSRVLRMTTTRLADGSQGYRIAVVFQRALTELRVHNWVPPASAGAVAALPIPVPLAAVRPSDDRFFADVPELLLLTAVVPQSRHELWEVLNGNDW